jgi:RNA polymerase sigma factor (sigma-70 family)
MSRRLTAEESAGLVRAAAGGDRAAWEALVEAYTGLVWAISRSYRLSAGDAADVAQTTWLRLVEHVDRLSEPASVGAWLATTTRHECLRLLRRAKQIPLVPAADVLLEVLPDDQPAVDSHLLAQERQADVRRAVAQLPHPAQQLLTLLMLDPPPTYAEISAATGMPIGSIGPTRARLLRKVERLLAEV